MKLESGQQVNKLGKYMYKHIDGAYKVKFSPNVCDVYMYMYYQIPGDSESFNQMNLDINITTYQKKIRVNVTEMNDLETTLGHKVYKPEEVEDIEKACKKIYQQICAFVENAYEDYDFIF